MLTSVRFDQTLSHELIAQRTGMSAFASPPPPSLITSNPLPAWSPGFIDIWMTFMQPGKGKWTDFNWPPDRNLPRQETEMGTALNWGFGQPFWGSVTRRETEMGTALKWGFGQPFWGSVTRQET